MLIDLILRNGVVFAEGVFQSKDVAIEGGKILPFGEAYGQAKREIDLEGKYVLPGFVDSHTHMLNLGLQLTRLDLSGCTSRQEAIDAVKSYVTSSKSQVIVGYGWDESVWGKGERYYLSKDELEFSSKPIVLYRRDGHMAVVNSAALKKLGLKSEDGVIKEEELHRLAPLVAPDPEETKTALSKAISFAISQGVTAVRDFVDVGTLRAYSEITSRMNVVKSIYADEYYEGFKSATNWGVKTFLDGSIGAMTAAHQGWAKSNLKMDLGKFVNFAQGFWSKGVSVAVHAIGELAVETAVEAFSNSRIVNSIEHFELVPEGVLDRVGNTFISSQPNFLQWALPGGLYESRLGKAWLTRNNSFRQYIDNGLNLAFGSDCMPLGPNYGIYYAISSPFANQRITLEEALTAYTEGSARLLRDPMTGKISPGYYANLVIFDEKYARDVNSLKDKKPLMTIIRGSIVYKSDVLDRRTASLAP